MKQRKVYDREFKEQAVQLSYERDNLSLFRELGISRKQLYSWRSQYKETFARQLPQNIHVIT